MEVSEPVEHLLKQGKKPRRLVELGFPKCAVTRVRRKLGEERASRESKAPKSGATARSDSQLAAISAGGTVPPEVAALVTAAEDLAAYRREVCLQQSEGVCDCWIWPSREEITGGIEEAALSLRKNDSWHVRLSPSYFAMCTVSMQHRAGEVAESLKGDPLANACRVITCKACGYCHKVCQTWQADLVDLVPQAVMAFGPAHE